MACRQAWARRSRNRPVEVSYLGRGELSVRVQAEDLLKLLESVHNRPDVVVGFQRALAYFVLLRLEPHQKKCREVCKTEI